MVIVEVWPKGYADDGGLTRVELPNDATDDDVRRAVRSVGISATLAGVRIKSVAPVLTLEEIASYRELYAGDNT